MDGARGKREKRGTCACWEIRTRVSGVEDRGPNHCAAVLFVLETETEVGPTIVIVVARLTSVAI